jgi:hypothetical protein
MREQQNTIRELDCSRRVLIAQLDARLRNFQANLASAESAEIVAEADSADGLLDRIHRLSQLVRSR